jgi:mRNA interferase MazF
MTGFDFGDVILVPFPFTNQRANKQRPAVVVSSDAYHRRRPDLIIIAITSQLRFATFGEAAIAQWQAAGLLKPSMLKRLLATVEQRLVRRKRGRLAVDDLRTLRQVLDTVVGS